MQLRLLIKIFILQKVEFVINNVLTFRDLDEAPKCVGWS